MIDILNPELVWIEGRCYRVNDTNTVISAHEEHDLYENDVPFQEDDLDEDDNVEVVMIDHNRYTTSFHVSKHYLGSIIGRKGAVASRIERDTKTQIKIPGRSEAKDIMIFGSTVSSVKAARRRINMIVMSSRMKQLPTHFISIPMNQQNIGENFERFKEAVLRECSNSKGVEESIFNKPPKLHVTVGMMCLMDNEERLFASKILTEAKENIIMPLLSGHLPLKIRLQGLSYMNDDPKEMHVLYGCVKEVDAPSGILQTLVDSIYDHFYRAGLMFREFDRDFVKIHVTLLNSKYRGRKSNGDRASDSKNVKIPFDGSEILAKFSNFDFGVTELSSIHLSQRNAKGPDGYYQSTCVITFS